MTEPSGHVCVGGAGAGTGGMSIGGGGAGGATSACFQRIPML